MTKPKSPTSAQRVGAPALSAAPPCTERVTTTLAETARLTGLSRSELYRLLATGRLRAVKANRRTLVLWDSVLAYLDSLPSATFRGPRSRPSERIAP